MRYCWIALALWVAQSPGAGANAYQGRRAELRKATPGGVIALLGRAEAETGDLRSGFFQEPNFYYLTGWLEPGAALLISPDGETLFLPPKDPDAEKWTGAKASAGDGSIREATGFGRVLPMQSFESELLKLLDRYNRLYALKGTPAASRIEKLAPLRELTDARPALGRLRMKKSPEEIALIERATGVSIEAHRAAWRRVTPGLYEYQIAASLESIFGENGCERPAYAPIVGSGPNSVFLHYSRNKRRMDRGELLLVDAAAECSAYVSDITRTIPVGGRFSKRQREIYGVVLGAQKAAIAAVKPGVTLLKDRPNSVYTIAYDYINTHGKDLHGGPLGKYFTHGVGHHVGLEVHDESDRDAPLEAGMVITVEPGLYIPEENLGVRIEDIVLVTESGSRVLSAALPREPGEIERAIAR